MFKVNDVVQFVENHKWCGCFGIVTEVKDCGDDVRLMIGVPVPEQGVAYIFSMVSEKEKKLNTLDVRSLQFRKKIKKNQKKFKKSIDICIFVWYN